MKRINKNQNLAINLLTVDADGNAVKCTQFDEFTGFVYTADKTVKVDFEGRITNNSNDTFYTLYLYADDLKNLADGFFTFVIKYKLESYATEQESDNLSEYYLTQDTNNVVSDNVINQNVIVSLASAGGTTFNLPFWSGTGEGSIIANYSENIASGYHSFAEGGSDESLGDANTSKAMGNYSHAEGESMAAGNDSHAEGHNTIASGESSHAEGSYTKAYGIVSHAEGINTSAVGFFSHAEGMQSVASGFSSHAEGYYTSVIGFSSHAEGEATRSLGEGSHAEGQYTIASEDSSHAEGTNTSAIGFSSHAEGQYTIARNRSEHASGQHNVSHTASTTFGNSGNTLFSVGNGTATTAPKNAFEIRQNGDIYIPYNGNNSVMLQLLLNQTIEHLTSTGTTLSLKPNRYYVFDVKISTLNLSLDSSYTETNLLYTYSVEFMPTGTMSVTLPSGVKWVNDTTPTFTELMKYRIEIKHGFADIVKVSE